RERPARGDVRQAQGAEHGLRDQERIVDRRQGDEPGAIRQAARQVGGGAKREPGLASSPAPRERQQSGRGQQPLDLGQLVAPADEAGELRRQVARPRPGGPYRHLTRGYTPATDSSGAARGSTRKRASGGPGSRAPGTGGSRHRVHVTGSRSSRWAMLAPCAAETMRTPYREIRDPLRVVPDAAAAAGN